MLFLSSLGLLRLQWELDDFEEDLLDAERNLKEIVSVRKWGEGERARGENWTIDIPPPSDQRL